MHRAHPAHRHRGAVGGGAHGGARPGRREQEVRREPHQHPAGRPGLPVAHREAAHLHRGHGRGRNPPRRVPLPGGLPRRALVRAGRDEDAQDHRRPGARAEQGGQARLPDAPDLLPVGGQGQRLLGPHGLQRGQRRQGQRVRRADEGLGPGPHLPHLRQPEHLLRRSPGVLLRDRRQAPAVRHPALPLQPGCAEDRHSEDAGPDEGRSEDLHVRLLPEGHLQLLHLLQVQGAGHQVRLPLGGAALVRQRAGQGHGQGLPQEAGLHPGLHVHGEAAQGADPAPQRGHLALPHVPIL